MLRGNAYVDLEWEASGLTTGLDGNIDNFVAQFGKVTSLSFTPRCPTPPSTGAKRSSFSGQPTAPTRRTRGVACGMVGAGMTTVGFNRGRGELDQDSDYCVRILPARFVPAVSTSVRPTFDDCGKPQT